LAPLACGQTRGAAASALFEASAAPAQGESLTQGEIVREIDDPHTGDRWLLMRNDRSPGGPGRLVRITAHRATTGASSPAAGLEEKQQLVPVIRAGDRLVVEEHTSVVDAALEACALNPAALGSALDVRLTIGGKVMRAVALGPGRAALEVESGVRP
jgi:hypothetical protein